MGTKDIKLPLTLLSLRGFFMGFWNFHGTFHGTFGSLVATGYQSQMTPQTLPPRGGSLRRTRHTSDHQHTSEAGIRPTPNLPPKELELCILKSLKTISNYAAAWRRT